MSARNQDLMPPARRLTTTRIIGTMVLATVTALLTLTSLPDAQSPKRRTVYPNRFPDGAGGAIATRACLTCHSATLTTQQRKDSTGWEKSLRQMETWGVKLTPSERETLFTYLRARFGPVKK
jgi:hypothetical protein